MNVTSKISEKSKFTPYIKWFLNNKLNATGLKKNLKHWFWTDFGYHVFYLENGYFSQFQGYNKKTMYDYKTILKALFQVFKNP